MDPNAVVDGAAGAGSAPRRKRRIIWISVLAGVAVLAAFTTLIVWALGQADTSARGGDMDEYRTAYESAMAKAGVDAQFPGRAVDLSDVEVTGSQPLDATFTAEEVSALLNIYRFSGSTDVALSDVDVEFPSAGVVQLSGKLNYQGSSYRATMTAPVAFDGRITSPGATSLNVSGFSVSGQQRTQATQAVVDYFNEALQAAPGLTVESASIGASGVRVQGTAPTSISHPAE